LSGESGKIMSTLIRRFVMYNLQSTNCHNKVEQCSQNTGTIQLYTLCRKATSNTASKE